VYIQKNFQSHLLNLGPIKAYQSIPCVTWHWTKRIQRYFRSTKWEWTFVVQVHLGTACLMAAFICRMLTCTLALVQVVAILDADFIPGPRTFVDGLRIPAVYDHLTTLLRDKRAVVVIPAFEHRVGYHWWHDVDNNSGIDEEVLKRANQLVSELVDAQNKSQLVLSCESGDILPFQLDYHKLTDYPQWLKASDYYEIQHADSGPDYKGIHTQHNEPTPCPKERHQRHARKWFGRRWHAI
jgi:hypothetical protein